MAPAVAIITETVLTKPDMDVSFTVLALANISAPAPLILPQLPRLFQSHPLPLKAVRLTQRVLLPPTLLVLDLNVVSAMLQLQSTERSTFLLPKGWVIT